MKPIVARPMLVDAITQPDSISGLPTSRTAVSAVEIPTLDSILNDPAVLAGLTRDVLMARAADAGAVHAALRAAAAVAATHLLEDADDLQLLDAEEVAVLLGTKKAVVYEAARRGLIGRVSPSIGSRSVRFTRQQVADFIKSREKPALD
jgi:excisionase family DNA binding protein